MANLSALMVLQLQQFDAEHGNHSLLNEPDGQWLVFPDGCRREASGYGKMEGFEWFKSRPRQLVGNKILYQQRLIEVELVPAFDEQKARLLELMPADDDEAEAEVAKLKRLQARIRQARAKIANLRLELEVAGRPAPSTVEDLTGYQRSISETRSVIRFLEGELRIFDSRHSIEDVDGRPFDPATSTNPGIAKTHARLVANRRLLAEQEANLADAIARNNEPPEVRKQRLAQERAEEKASGRKQSALMREVKALEV